MQRHDELSHFWEVFILLFILQLGTMLRMTAVYLLQFVAAPFSLVFSAQTVFRRDSVERDELGCTFGFGLLLRLFVHRGSRTYVFLT